MAVVRINVTQEVRKTFLTAFASQSVFENRKAFAAHVIAQGLEKLTKNANPPGDPPRSIPSADGGNRGIEFSKSTNKALVEKLQKFRAQHTYLSQPVANRACLYAGLGIPQPWS